MNANATLHGSGGVTDGPERVEWLRTFYLDGTTAVASVRRADGTVCDFHARYVTPDDTWVAQEASERAHRDRPEHPVTEAERCVFGAQTDVDGKRDAERAGL